MKKLLVFTTSFLISLILVIDNNAPNTLEAIIFPERTEKPIENREFFVSEQSNKLSRSIYSKALFPNKPYYHVFNEAYRSELNQKTRLFLKNQTDISLKLYLSNLKSSTVIRI